MADSFDPYRKWLAIPADEQPADYYRLLAIPVFESDPDVISNAADGRMSQIKSYQTGPYAKLSQRILNEIAAAKICLLDPQKKAVYDRGLREKLQPAEQAAEFDLASLATRTLSRTSPGPKRKKKTKSWLVPAIVAGALALAGSAAAIVFMLPPQNERLESQAKKQPSPPTPLPKGEGSQSPSPSASLPKGEGSQSPSASLPKGEGSHLPSPSGTVQHRPSPEGRGEKFALNPGHRRDPPQGDERYVRCLERAAGDRAAARRSETQT